jgi:hypothetical protein
MADIYKTMNSSNPSKHFLDTFPYEMTLAVKAAECVVLPFLVGLVIAMYKGIEINHPGIFFRFECLKTPHRFNWKDLQQFSGKLFPANLNSIKFVVITSLSPLFYYVPVYAVLFHNICFTCCCTIWNTISIAFIDSFRIW